MTAITIEMNDELAAKLRRFAADLARTEEEIVRDALAAYVETPRPLPKGMGKYRSGASDTSERARESLRQAAQDKKWP